MDDAQTRDQADAVRNGMTEAEWLALPEAARAWRRDHPRPEHAPVDAHQFDTGQGHGAEPAPPTAPKGSQVVLEGDAQAAARGELHGSIEHNTAARDEALGSA